jgi:hypothetical protein
MVDLRSSALATGIGMALGLLGTIHGIAPVHAANPTVLIVSAPAPTTAIGAAASLVYLRAR